MLRFLPACGRRTGGGGGAEPQLGYTCWAASGTQRGPKGTVLGQKSARFGTCTLTPASNGVFLPMVMTNQACTNTATSANLPTLRYGDAAARCGRLCLRVPKSHPRPAQRRKRQR